MEDRETRGRIFSSIWAEGEEAESMEDGRIIELYWERDQRAIPETDGKYGRMLHGISWNLLRSREDAEECVNDTYLRAWEAIPPARPGALRNWLGQITRNLSLDRWKRLRAEKRGGGAEALLGELEDCLPGTAGRSVEDLELAECTSMSSGRPRRFPVRMAVKKPESGPNRALIWAWTVRLRRWGSQRRDPALPGPIVGVPRL